MLRGFRVNRPGQFPKHLLPMLRLWTDLARLRGWVLVSFVFVGISYYLIRLQYVYAFFRGVSGILVHIHGGVPNRKDRWLDTGC